MNRKPTTTFTVVSAAYLVLGLAQVSSGGVVNTADALAAESRTQQIATIEQTITRQDVGDRLLAYGVSPDSVMARVQNLSDEELLELQTSIDEHVAGGDAIGIIGAVFLVLLILELVGITDVFKAI